MADKTIEYTSTGSGSKSYSAYASDSCGNKDYGTWYWGGDVENKGQNYVLGTAGLSFSQSNGKFTLTGPTKGNAPNFNLVWKSPKLNNGGVTYTVAVVFNIPNTLEKLCPSLQINGRDWDLRLDEPAASDVDYLFDASNGYEHEGGTSTDDISVTITIKKGNKVGQYRTSQFEFAVYAILVSTDPYKDDTYIYGDCDVEWGNV